MNMSDCHVSWTAWRSFFLQLMPPEVKACGQGAGSLDELLKVRCVFGGKQSIGFGQMNVTPFEVT